MKSSVFVRCIVSTFILLALSTGAQATPRYRYAGVSHTAQVAYYTTATMTFTALPSVKVCSLNCHVLSWTILAQSARFENYVEAGVGFEPIKNSDNTWVALWWTNQQKKVAQIVGYVPIGTSVKVEISKVNGSKIALVQWTWPNGYKKRKVSLDTWLVGPGIHPTQLEVASPSSSQPPPVTIDVTDINLYIEDEPTTYLYKDAPYIPTGSLDYTTLKANFSVDVH